MSSTLSEAFISDGGQLAAIASHSPMNAGSPWTVTLVLTTRRPFTEGRALFDCDDVKKA
jgi:hypothetical protein